MISLRRSGHLPCLAPGLAWGQPGSRVPSSLTAGGHSQTATTTTVFASPNPSVVGSAVTATAT